MILSDADVSEWELSGVITKCARVLGHGATNTAEATAHFRHRGRANAQFCDGVLERSGQRSRNAQLLHLGNQGRALESKPGGGALRASDGPVGFGERLDDMFACGILQGRRS